MKIKLSKDASIDLDVLVRTRLLIQANSGGGKSWLIRRIAEQAHGKIQIIIIDPEGEFATLREKFDFALIGKGGESPADVRSAGLVAHKLLELRASAVCDLYEMKSHDRHQWVKSFIDALIDAPKKLWHSLLVVVDEAHVFAPEKGAGESIASDAMISLATRGRKRGYCPIFATQRLGKLRKDAAAELTNILIGQTFIDIDRKRAAEALGIPRSEQEKFNAELRILKPGKFFALGRAISTERILVDVGGIETTHPEVGTLAKVYEPPPPPEKIKALLPKLSDLPRLAEAKAITEKELRAEISQLRRDLASAKKPAPIAPAQKSVEIKVPVFNGELKRLEKFAAQIERTSLRLEPIGKQLVEVSREMKSAAGDVLTAVRMATQSTQRAHVFQKPILSPVVQKSEIRREPKAATIETDGDDIKLDKARRSILIALAQHPDGLTKRQIAVMAGYAHNGGAFNNAMSYLKVRQAIMSHDQHFTITDIGLSALGNSWEPLPQGEELYQYWMQQLNQAEREVLRVLHDNYPQEMTKHEVAAQTVSSNQQPYDANGGAFNNAISKLRTLMLINGRQRIKACDEFFE